MSMMRKTSKGRQKIEIKRIQNEDARKATFSKRREGVFKKATELSILCGAEIAIVVFSPAGRAFSFGSPNVETVMDRFLNGTPSDKHCEDANLTDLKRQYKEVHDQLDAEKQKTKELRDKKEIWKQQYWWEAPVETLGLEQLEELKSSMEELQKLVANRVDEIWNMTNAMNLMSSRGRNSLPPMMVERSADVFPQRYSHGHSYDHAYFAGRNGAGGSGLH